MAESKNTPDNCFDVFGGASPRKKETSIQVLYDYEKHYMELVRKYSPEISMIADMLRDFRNEQKRFYEEELPEISAKLNQDVGIDDEMRKIWLNRLMTNMDSSFRLSETLINDYVTKSVAEFKAAVNTRLQKL